MCSRMLAGSDKSFSGPYSPHGKIDDGGVLMKEIMTEFELCAANTHFKPTKSTARNTGTATYTAGTNRTSTSKRPGTSLHLTATN